MSTPLARILWVPLPALAMLDLKEMGLTVKVNCYAYLFPRVRCLWELLNLGSCFIDRAVVWSLCLKAEV